MSEKDTKFSIQGASKSFFSRQSDIFGSLNAHIHEPLGQPLEENIESAPALAAVGLNLKEPTTSGNSQEPFKAPQRQARRRRHDRGRIEGRRSFQNRDSIRASGKFTEYTLRDVSENHMSDSANAGAAMAFLRAQQEAKEVEGEPEVSQVTCTFQKPSRVEHAQPDSEEPERTTGRLAKHTMPEYVVGATAAATKRKQISSARVNSAPDSQRKPDTIKPQFDWDCDAADVKDSNVIDEPDPKAFKKSSRKRGFRARSSDSD